MYIITEWVYVHHHDGFLLAYKITIKYTVEYEKRAADKSVISGLSKCLEKCTENKSWNRHRIPLWADHRSHFLNIYYFRFVYQKKRRQNITKSKKGLTHSSGWREKYDFKPKQMFLCRRLAFTFTFVGITLRVYENYSIVLDKKRIFSLSLSHFWGRNSQHIRQNMRIIRYMQMELMRYKAEISKIARHRTVTYNLDVFMNIKWLIRP